MDTDKERGLENDNELVVFLKDARNGKYAEIDKESLSYLRYKILSEPMEEQYFYSLR